MAARTNNFTSERGRVTSMFYYLIPLNSCRLCHPPLGILRANQRCGNRASKSVPVFLYIFANCIKRERERDSILSHATSFLYPFLFKDYLKQFSQPSSQRVLSLPRFHVTREATLWRDTGRRDGKINMTEWEKIILFIINV